MERVALNPNVNDVLIARVKVVAGGTPTSGRSNPGAAGKPQ